LKPPAARPVTSFSAASAPDPAAVTLAPHHLRLFALLADYLLVIVVLNLADQIALGPGWDLRPVPESHWPALFERIGWGALLLLVKDAALGTSPGKWLTGIGARDAADPARPVPRALLALRNVTLWLLPLEIVLVFVDRYGRRLGDRIAGTVVVALPSPARIGRRLLVLAALLFAGMLLGFLVAPWNMHRSAAYQEAARRVAADPRVIARAGAGAAMADAPGFDLELHPEGGKATLLFEARGLRGQAKGRLELRLDREAGAWRLEQLTVDEPKLDVNDAPARR
jgi:hypothetical protein